LDASSVKLNVTGEAAPAAALASDVSAGPASAADGQEADLELVGRCRGGELSAFELLVERYQDRIYNLVLRMTGRPEDAADLTQEVFLRAIEHIGRFRQKAQVFTWLFRIAVNLAISRRRRDQRVRFVSLDSSGADASESGEPQPIDPASSREEQPDEAAERDEQNRRVAQAVAELDDQFRAVLVLKDIEGLDYRQIADVLDLPLGTIKSRLHRARNELRVRLRPIVSL
jgi:RNA polymerase sigma-70 factor (ECF subfamily)